jgi:DNA/RNA-binding domain of Phe-tRNA-synthetase-like protein
MTDRAPDESLSGHPPAPTTEAGWVAPELRREFPGLGLRWFTLEAEFGRSPRELRRRLAELSNRFAGAQAIALRQQPIPWAYRVFFRHIGLDPDEQPTPVEALALERMKRGGFHSQSRLDDALTVATMESGVAVRAFDADRIAASPGIRPSEPGEELEGRPGELPTGTLVIADAERPLALLFGPIADGRGVRSRTRRATICAVQVKGVPDIAVEEALWLAAEGIRG